jgi:hypothetical protein
MTFASQFTVSMQMLVLCLGLTLFGTLGTHGAQFLQSFDSGMVVNGTANAVLSDGARVDGSAVVANGTLVLTTKAMVQTGRLFVPALANSSLGWTASFSLQLNGTSQPGDGVGLVWGNTEAFAFAAPIVVQGSMGGNIGNKPANRFLAWIIDTYGLLMTDSPGFFVVNSTGVRTAAASFKVTTLPASRSVSATVFAAWNPQRGATLRTTGFSTNVNFSDIPMVHTGNDTHSWMFVGETGELFEFAAIDNIVIDAPCGECERAGKSCVWNQGAQFDCIAPTIAPTPKPTPSAIVTLAPTPATTLPNTCATRQLIITGANAVSTIGATTCPTCGACAIQNDTWYEWHATCTGTATIDGCSFTNDTMLGVYCLIYTSMNTAAPLEAVCAVFMLERKSAHAHNRTP